MARRKADILWGVAALVWAVVIPAAWMLWSLERNWDGLGQRVAGLEEEARRTGAGPRPRIREVVDDGDAWDAYLQAMEECRWRESAIWMGVEYYLAGLRVPTVPDADPGNPEHWGAPPLPYETLEVTSVALETWRRGVRRQARNPGPGLVVYPVEALGYLGILESMRRFEEGLPEEGLEAALDVLQYTADLTWRGDDPLVSRSGMKLAEFMLWQLKLRMESGGMDSGEALRLAQSLRALESSIPSLDQVLLPMLARHAGRLASGKVLLSMRGSDIPWTTHRDPGWRHLWSWKALRLGTLGRLEGMMRDYARVDRLSPTEAAQVESLIQEEAARSRTALSPEELCRAVGLGEDVGHARFRALLRMLEAAARFHATGGPAPKGEEFHCTPELTWSLLDASVARPWRVRPCR